MDCRKLAEQAHSTVPAQNQLRTRQLFHPGSGRSTDTLFHSEIQHPVASGNEDWEAVLLNEMEQAKVTEKATSTSNFLASPWKAVAEEWEESSPSLEVALPSMDNRHISVQSLSTSNIQVWSHHT